MLDTTVTKRCSTCKEVKPISEFYKTPKNKDGYSGACKPCRRLRNKEYSLTPNAIISHRKACIKYSHTGIGRKKLKIIRRKYEKSQKGKKAARKRYRTWQYKEQKLARDTIQRAIKKGIVPHIQLMKCDNCGSKAYNYHHPSHAKENRLKVIPLCISCHKQIHKAIA